MASIPWSLVPNPYSLFPVPCSLIIRQVPKLSPACVFCSSELGRIGEYVTMILFISLIINILLLYSGTGTQPLPQPKRPEKTVDPACDWVYIHECHPFKGSFQYDLARPSAISRIKWSWGFSVDAPVRFDARRKWKSWVYGFPGWHSVSAIRQKAVYRRAKVREDF